MAKTITYAVDSITPVAVQVRGADCNFVEICEDNQAGTQDYTIKRPASTDTAITRPAGSRFPFTAPVGRPFFKNEIIGYVQTTAGSITMSQHES